MIITIFISFLPLVGLYANDRIIIIIITLFPSIDCFYFHFERTMVTLGLYLHRASPPLYYIKTRGPYNLLI